MTRIIRKDTVWRAGDTITLNEDVQIAHGVTLTIEAGVHVIGKGHEVQAFGKLAANGNSSDGAVVFDNVEFTFGSSSSTPGEIKIDKADFSGGSFLDATGNGSYGSFHVSESNFKNVDGFYIWYPVAESSLVGNTFVNSDGLSIGSRVDVNILNNTFGPSTGTFYGASSITVWANYNGSAIHVIGNKFQKGVNYAMEFAKGYSGKTIVSNNNYFADIDDKPVEQFILDANDDLSRPAVIDLGWVLANGKDNSMIGSFVTDSFKGLRGNDLLVGGGGADTLVGGKGVDTLSGGSGNDMLRGNQGIDKLFGGKGRDVLYGGNGNDLISGDLGNDVLVGGGGSDTFRFRDGSGADKIKKFASLDDAEKIDLSRVTSITSFSDLSANHMAQVGADVVIDALAGDTITLVDITLGDLDAADFIF